MPANSSVRSVRAHVRDLNKQPPTYAAITIQRIRADTHTESSLLHHVTRWRRDTMATKNRENNEEEGEKKASDEFRIVDVCSACNQSFADQQNHPCLEKERSAATRRNEEQLLHDYNVGWRQGLNCCHPCQKVFTSGHRHTHKVPSDDKRTQTIKCGLARALKPKYSEDIVRIASDFARQNQEACIMASRLLNLALIQTLNAGQPFFVSQDLVQQAIAQVCKKHPPLQSPPAQQKKPKKETAVATKKREEAAQKKEAAARQKKATAEDKKARIAQKELEKLQNMTEAQRKKEEAEKQKKEAEGNKKKLATQHLEDAYRENYIPSIRDYEDRCTPSSKLLSSTAHQYSARMLLTNFDNMHQATAFARHRSWMRFELLRTMGWAGQAHVDRAATTKLVGELAKYVFTNNEDIPTEEKLLRDLRKCHRAKIVGVEQEAAAIDAWTEAQRKLIQDVILTPTAQRARPAFVLMRAGGKSSGSHILPWLHWIMQRYEMYNANVEEEYRKQRLFCLFPITSLHALYMPFPVRLWQHVATQFGLTEETWYELFRFPRRFFEQLDPNTKTWQAVVSNTSTDGLGISFSREIIDPKKAYARSKEYARPAYVGMKDPEWLKKFTHIATIDPNRSSPYTCVVTRNQAHPSYIEDLVKRGENDLLKSAALTHIQQDNMKVCGISTKEWAELRCFRKHRKERSDWLKKNPAIVSLQESVPLLKTTDVSQLEANLRYMAEHMKTLLDFYLSRKHRRQRLQAYSANTTAWTEVIKKVLHSAHTLTLGSDAPFRLKGRAKAQTIAGRHARQKKTHSVNSKQGVPQDIDLVDLLCGSEFKILFVVGDGMFNHASRGHAATPTGQRITQELKRLGQVCSADEFRTSLFCSKCHHKTRSIRQSDDHVQNHLDHLAKKGVPEHKLPRKQSVRSPWGVRVCLNCRTPWDRDVNACLNMQTQVLRRAFGLKPLAAYRRMKKQAAIEGAPAVGMESSSPVDSEATLVAVTTAMAPGTLALDKTVTAAVAPTRKRQSSMEESQPASGPTLHPTTLPFTQNKKLKVQVTSSQ